MLDNAYDEARIMSLLVSTAINLTVLVYSFEIIFKRQVFNNTNEWSNFSPIN